MLKFATLTQETLSSSAVLKQLAEKSGKTAEEVIMDSAVFIASAPMQPGCQFKVTDVSVLRIKDTKILWGRVECKDVKTGDVYVISAKKLWANPASLSDYVTDPTQKLTHQFSKTKGGEKLTKEVSPDCLPLNEGEKLYVPPTRSWSDLVDYFRAELEKPDHGELGSTVFTYKGTVCHPYKSKSAGKIEGDFCQPGWQRVLPVKVFTV